VPPAASGLASVTGPKKETARITVLPDPAPRPAGVQMKKTQPLIAAPEHVAPAPPVRVNIPEPIAVGPVATTANDELPMIFCWALLGVSTAILLIQIWNYVS
jgi:hypothetical protein